MDEKEIRIRRAIGYVGMFFFLLLAIWMWRTNALN